MITVEIKGPDDSASKLAKRLASAEQQGGKVVRLYEHDALVPENMPGHTDIVIVVTHT